MTKVLMTMGLPSDRSHEQSANIEFANSITYLTDIRHRADYGSIRAEFFGENKPAGTLVAVTALAQPEFLIEIEAVAVL